MKNNKIQQKRIFITGGLGYIGTAFTKEAIKKGYEITLFDSLMYGQDYKKILKEISLKKSEAIKLIIGDTRNTALLEKSLKDFKPDYVLHMGELSSIFMCQENPPKTKTTNHDASKKIFDICEKLNIPVLYNSSSSVYGSRKGSQLVTEKSSVPTPINNYSKYKLLMESYIKEKKKRNKNFKIIIFRPATVSGVSPRMRMGLILNHFTYCAIAKGVIKISKADSYRAEIDIQDLINAYIHVIEKGIWKKLIYNIGHYNLTKKQYAEKVKSVTGCKTEEIYDNEDLRDLRIDCSLFNKEFNFKPQIKHTDTIKSLVKWLRENKNKIEKTNFTSILNMSYARWKEII